MPPSPFSTSLSSLRHRSSVPPAPPWLCVVPALPSLCLEIDEDYNFFPELDFDVVGQEDFLSHELIASDDLQGKATLKDQSLSGECNSKTMSNSCTDEITSFEEMLRSFNDESFSPKLSSSSSVLSFKSHQILSFDNSDSLSSSPPNNSSQFYGLKNTLNQNQEMEVSLPFQTTPNNNNNNNNNNNIDSLKTQNWEAKSSSTLGKRSPSHAQDHIIAERKRREKISQSFIALAALIPGLKKMDKASVLGDSIKYVKELKERLAVLEQECNKAKTLTNPIRRSDTESCEDQSIDAAASSYGKGNNNNNNNNNNNDSESSSLPSLPQVEARECGQELLLRIHCFKEEDILVKIFSHIQSLRLMVLNSSVLSFGDSILDITIVVQAGEGYSLTLNEVVKNLRMATLKFIS
ncbi:hypothetical protein PIB30_039445 [Stylosanthes scabra]|uniref:BHLH domain-containing protein n=1 Tax=Stylosanthes scabra TaxID=79078 RepID=A0ABU6UHH5_9FABA|nr:hypothetical protein [Stylosanthes scabra]